MSAAFATRLIAVNNNSAFVCPWVEGLRARGNKGSDCKIRGCRQSPPRRTVRAFACCNCKQMSGPYSCPRTTGLGKLHSGERRTKSPLPWPLESALLAWVVLRLSRCRIASSPISFQLTPQLTRLGPAVIWVRIAKSAVAGNHLLCAHFKGPHTAIVDYRMADILDRAP